MTLLLSDIDQAIVECIESSVKGRARNCARNAVHHLEMAWAIKDIDPEMAIFRAITAEEEAATSIFIALREKKYKNANKIEFKNHSYKQALIPFIRGISKFVADTARLPGFPFGQNYQLFIERKGKVKKPKLLFRSQNGTFMPIPPLGFEIKKNGKPYYFDEELLEVTSGKNKEDIIKYINKIANLRNELLYACSEGIPRFDGKIDKVLKKKQDNVFVLLRIFCLIFPYKEKALFVQQSLNAFLAMMGDIEQMVEKET